MESLDAASEFSAIQQLFSWFLSASLSIIRCHSRHRLPWSRSLQISVDLSCGDSLLIQFWFTASFTATELLIVTVTVATVAANTASGRTIWPTSANPERCTDHQSAKRSNTRPRACVAQGSSRSFGGFLGRLSPTLAKMFQHLWPTLFAFCCSDYPVILQSKGCLSSGRKGDADPETACHRWHASDMRVTWDVPHRILAAHDMPHLARGTKPGSGKWHEITSTSCHQLLLAVTTASCSHPGILRSRRLQEHL